MKNIKAKKVVSEILLEAELANGNFISLEKTKSGYRVSVFDAGGNVLKCLGAREGLFANNIAILKEVLDVANKDYSKDDDGLILRIVNQTDGCTLRTLESLYFGTSGCFRQNPIDLHLAVDKLVESGKLRRMEWQVPSKKGEVFSLLLPQNSKMQVEDWDIFFDD